MNPSKITLVVSQLCAWVLLSVFSGCSDTGDDTGSGNTQPDDTDSMTDNTDDTDTMPPTPYDAVDCDGLGGDPNACESEICFHRSYYIEKLLACNAVPTDTCEAELDCYETEFACLYAACPPGTALPQTTDEKREAGIYDCDNDYLVCQAEIGN